jgi:hypothetical protein
MGERLTVQFARGTRNRDTFANTERTAPRPRRTPHRMQISGLPGETSWQVCFPVPSSGLLDLKSCYLDAEQHYIGTPSLYSDRSSAYCCLVLASIMPCLGQQCLGSVLVHLPEQPWT